MTVLATCSDLLSIPAPSRCPFPSLEQRHWPWLASAHCDWLAAGVTEPLALLGGVGVCPQVLLRG